MNHSWEKEILFNTQTLPGVAIAIDHLNQSTLEEIPDETSEWLWRFTICDGTENVELADTAIKHATIALSLLLSNRKSFEKNVSNKLGNRFVTETVNGWIKSLEIIIEEASKREMCHWKVK